MTSTGGAVATSEKERPASITNATVNVRAGVMLTKQAKLKSDRGVSQIAKSVVERVKERGEQVVQKFIDKAKQGEDSVKQGNTNKGGSNEQGRRSGRQPAPAGVTRAYSIVLTHVIAPLWTVGNHTVTAGLLHRRVEYKGLGHSDSKIFHLISMLDAPPKRTAHGRDSEIKVDGSATFIMEEKNYPWSLDAVALTIADDPELNTAYITLLLGRLFYLESLGESLSFAEIARRMMNEFSESPMQDYDEIPNDEVMAMDQPTRKLTEVGGDWKAVGAQDIDRFLHRQRHLCLLHVLGASIMYEYFYAEPTLQWLVDRIAGELFLLTYTEKLVSLVGGVKGPRYLAKYFLHIARESMEPVRSMIPNLPLASWVLEECTQLIELAVNDMVHRNDVSDVVLNSLAYALSRSLCPANKLRSLLHIVEETLRVMYCTDLTALNRLIDAIRPYVLMPDPSGPMALRVLRIACQAVQNVGCIQREFAAGLFVASSGMSTRSKNDREEKARERRQSQTMQDIVSLADATCHMSQAQASFVFSQFFNPSKGDDVIVQQPMRSTYLSSYYFGSVAGGGGVVESERLPITFYPSKTGFRSYRLRPALLVTNPTSTRFFVNAHIYLGRMQHNRECEGSAVLPPVRQPGTGYSITSTQRAKARNRAPTNSDSNARVPRTAQLLPPHMSGVASVGQPKAHGQMTLNTRPHSYDVSRSRSQSTGIPSRRRATIQVPGSPSGTRDKTTSIISESEMPVLVPNLPSLQPLSTSPPLDHKVTTDGSTAKRVAVIEDATSVVQLHGSLALGQSCSIDAGAVSNLETSRPPLAHSNPSTPSEKNTPALRTLSNSRINVSIRNEPNTTRLHPPERDEPLLPFSMLDDTVFYLANTVLNVFQAACEMAIEAGGGQWQQLNPLPPILKVQHAAVLLPSPSSSEASSPAGSASPHGSMAGAPSHHGSMVGSPPPYPLTVNNTNNASPSSHNLALPKVSSFRSDTGKRYNGTKTYQNNATTNTRQQQNVAALITPSTFDVSYAHVLGELAAMDLKRLFSLDPAVLCQYLPYLAAVVRWGSISESIITTSAEKEERTTAQERYARMKRGENKRARRRRQKKSRSSTGRNSETSARTGRHMVPKKVFDMRQHESATDGFQSSSSDERRTRTSSSLCLTDSSDDNSPQLQEQNSFEQDADEDADKFYFYDYHTNEHADRQFQFTSGHPFQHSALSPASLPVSAHVWRNHHSLSLFKRFIDHTQCIVRLIILCHDDQAEGKQNTVVALLQNLLHHGQVNAVPSNSLSMSSGRKSGKLNPSGSSNQLFTLSILHNSNDLGVQQQNVVATDEIQSAVTTYTPRQDPNQDTAPPSPRRTTSVSSPGSPGSERITPNTEGQKRAGTTASTVNFFGSTRADMGTHHNILMQHNTIVSPLQGAPRIINRPTVLRNADYRQTTGEYINSFRTAINRLSYFYNYEGNDKQNAVTTSRDSPRAVQPLASSETALIDFGGVGRPRLQLCHASPSPNPHPSGGGDNSMQANRSRRGRQQQSLLGGDEPSTPQHPAGKADLDTGTKLFTHPLLTCPRTLYHILTCYHHICAHHSPPYVTTMADATATVPHLHSASKASKSPTSPAPYRPRPLGGSPITPSRGMLSFPPASAIDSPSPSVQRVRGTAAAATNDHAVRHPSFDVGTDACLPTGGPFRGVGKQRKDPDNDRPTGQDKRSGKTALLRRYRLVSPRLPFTPLIHTTKHLPPSAAGSHNTNTTERQTAPVPSSLSSLIPSTALLPSRGTISIVINDEYDASTPHKRQQQKSRSGARSSLPARGEARNRNLIDSTSDIDDGVDTWSEDSDNNDVEETHTFYYYNAAEEDDNSALHAASNSKKGSSSINHSINCLPAFLKNKLLRHAGNTSSRGQPVINRIIWRDSGIHHGQIRLILCYFLVFPSRDERLKNESDDINHHARQRGPSKRLSVCVKAADDPIQYLLLHYYYRIVFLMSTDSPPELQGMNRSNKSWMYNARSESTLNMMLLGDVFSSVLKSIPQTRPKPDGDIVMLMARQQQKQLELLCQLISIDSYPRRSRFSPHSSSKKNADDYEDRQESNKNMSTTDDDTYSPSSASPPSTLAGTCTNGMPQLALPGGSRPSGSLSRPRRMTTSTAPRLVSTDSFGSLSRERANSSFTGRMRQGGRVSNSRRGSFNSSVFSRFDESIKSVSSASEWDFGAAPSEQDGVTCVKKLIDDYWVYCRRRPPSVWSLLTSTLCGGAPKKLAAALAARPAVAHDSASRVPELNSPTSTSASPHGLLSPDVPPPNVPARANKDQDDSEFAFDDVATLLHPDMRDEIISALKKCLEPSLRRRNRRGESHSTPSRETQGEDATITLPFDDNIEDVIDVVLMGGTGSIRRFVEAILRLQQIFSKQVMPRLRLFVVPLGQDNVIAEWMARTDPLYMQRILAPVYGVPMRTLDPPTICTVDRQSMEEASFRSIRMRRQLDHYIKHARCENQVVVYQVECTRWDGSTFFIPMCAYFEVGVHITAAAAVAASASSTSSAGVQAKNSAASRPNNGVTPTEQLWQQNFSYEQATISEAVARAAGHRMDSTAVMNSVVLSETSTTPSTPPISHSPSSVMNSPALQQGYVSFVNEHTNHQNIILYEANGMLVKENANKILLRMHGQWGITLRPHLIGSNTVPKKLTATGEAIMSWLGATYSIFESSAATIAAQALLSGGLLKPINTAPSLSGLQTDTSVGRPFNPMGLYAITALEPADSLPLVISSTCSPTTDIAQSMWGSLTGRPSETSRFMNPTQSMRRYSRRRNNLVSSTKARIWFTPLSTGSGPQFYELTPDPTLPDPCPPREFCLLKVKSIGATGDYGSLPNPCNTSLDLSIYDPSARDRMRLVTIGGFVDVHGRPKDGEAEDGEIIECDTGMHFHLEFGVDGNVDPKCALNIDFSPGTKVWPETSSATPPMLNSQSQNELRRSFASMSGMGLSSTFSPQTNSPTTGGSRGVLCSIDGDVFGPFVSFKIRPIIASPAVQEDDDDELVLGGIAGQEVKQGNNTAETVTFMSFTPCEIYEE